MLKFRKYAVLVIVSVLVGALSACGNSIATPERSLQESVHYYIYDQQPVSGEAFVSFARAKLSKYSARKIQKALFTEGKRQAKEGHPNAIAALSLADQAWARENGLQYDVNEWIKLQKEAKENIKAAPSGTLQLWPSK